MNGFQPPVMTSPTPFPDKRGNGCGQVQPKSCLQLNLQKVAEEGLEMHLSFRGKTYLLAVAGDSRGITRAERP